MVGSDLRELYQEVILDHSKHPRNFRVIENADHEAEGFNPLCGDRYKIFIRVDGNRITDVSFQGSGCAISKASASIMTERVKGKTIAEASADFKAFRKMIAGKPGEAAQEEKLGKLSAFSGVCEFPLRVKCASLAWHTLAAGLEKSGQTVSTE